MSSLSPQRNRKPQGHQGSMQSVPPREMSPSPAFRDRQRSLKTQSLPLVPPVMQMYSNPNQSRQGLQPSPTISNGSHQSRRSPPPAQVTQLPPSSIKLPTLNTRNVSPEPMSPSPIHSHSQSNIHQTHTSSTQPQLSHNMHPQLGYPRPINRVQPQFLSSSFRQLEENWAMTAELMADIERADMQQAAAGTSGVAYAGGAASSGVTYSRVGSGSPLKDQGAERTRVDERTSPKDNDGGGPGGRRQSRTDREREQLSRESPKSRDRQSQPQPTSSPAFPQTHAQASTPERRSSPSYHSPLGSPGEHTASNYTQYKRETYPPHPRIPTPPLTRRPSNAPNHDPSNATKRSTPPATSLLSSQTPPQQAIKTRSPDRSLPVQEEPEEDVALTAKNGIRDREKWKGNEHLHLDEMSERMSSPTPSSDLHPEGHTSRFDTHGGRESRAGHREDDDETLIEQATSDRRSHDGSRDSEEEGHTPRSPSVTLPHDGQGRFYAQDASGRQHVRVRNRTGATDQMGMRGIETAYEQASNLSKIAIQTSGGRTNDTEPSRHPSQFDPSQQNRAAHLMPPDDFQNFFDDPTSAYLHAYLQSPRPNAPVPPTPHSQTAAPSPSPLISGMQSVPPYSPIPPVGSPYPYPFSHVRRSHGYANPIRPSASSTYDQNHPSVIQEQLALQWQMYALNNSRAPPSDSTLSPSSTPFQGAGYNPWAFLHTNRAFGGRFPDPMTSLQSSPSHEPIPLPLPPTGRGVKKRQRSVNLRSQLETAKPPPRVESTQPRETSPEPSSSGEETAGDGRYHLGVGEEGNWVNGIIHDDSGDWVDEDTEGDDDDDLLELEYHPSFVSNVEKRRRRWETRWQAMIEAFHALDRQTDATLVLFASPSHSTKLHSLTSRSVRRDPSLTKSPAFSNMRSAFMHVASKRRAARSHRSSLADRLLMASGPGSADGSENSSESREEDLKRALEAALGSLGALGGIYEQRETRWREEMRRVGEDRERVELLLQQALGVGLANGSTVGRAI